MAELPPRHKPRHDLPLKVKTISNCFKKVNNGDGFDEGVQNDNDELDAAINCLRTEEV